MISSSHTNTSRSRYAASIARSTTWRRATPSCKVGHEDERFSRQAHDLQRHRVRTFARRDFFKAHQEFVVTFHQLGLKRNTVRYLMMEMFLAMNVFAVHDHTSAGPFVVRMHVTSCAEGLTTRLYAQDRK